MVSVGNEKPSSEADFKAYYNGFILESTELINQLFKPKDNIMLTYAIIFFIIAIIAGLFGFRGVASVTARISKFLFFIFIVLFVLTLLAQFLQ